MLDRALFEFNPPDLQSQKLRKNQTCNRQHNSAEGESGMGYYHGRRGFETFSHSRGIVSAPRFSANRLMAPPYGKRIRKILDWMRRRELRAVGKRLPRLTKPPIQ